MNKLDCFSIEIGRKEFERRNYGILTFMEITNYVRKRE